MQLALLDILQSNTQVARRDREEQLASIQQHLQRLLNARRGCLQHLPDYGLPDLQTIFQDLPYSVGDLIRELTHTIQKYEPRLIQVKIKEVKDSDRMSILAFDIHAKIIPAHQVVYSTYFLSGSRTQVWYR